jgi:hypothetical protein
MGKKHLFFLLIFAQYFAICNGQGNYKPGYIITNNSDTTRGFIKMQSNYQNSINCNFEEDKNQSFKNFSPNEIKGYRIENSKYYVSRDIVLDSIKQKKFLEYLVKGIVDLYYYKDIGKEYYFVQKDTMLVLLSNDELIVTVKETGPGGEYEKSYLKNSNQYKRILQFLFKDSPEVLKEIPNTAFDYRPLIKITKDYHNSVCKNNECIDFTKSTSKSLYLESYFGIINSWMGLKTSKDYSHDLKPYLGLQLRLKPFKGISRWNFLVGLNYSTNSFYGDFDNYLYLPWLETYQIFAKYSIIRVPLVLEYTLSSKKFQPFISASYNNTFLFNTEQKVMRINTFNTYEEKTYFRKYEYGASIGFGLRYNLNGKSYFYLKNEVEYRMPSANLNWVLDYQRFYSWLINFGYGFKIN